MQYSNNFTDNNQNLHVLCDGPLKDLLFTVNMGNLKETL